MALFSLGGSVSNTTLNTSGQTNSNQTGAGSSNSTSTNTATQTGNQIATQDPLATAFRSGLYQQYNKNLAQTSAPVYGTGFQAGFTGNLDQSAKNATDSLKQSLAGNGQLDSGAFAQGVSDIQNNKVNAQAQENANLPAMEAAAQTARLSPLLAGANSLAASAPTSVATSGSTSGNQSTDSAYQTTLQSIINSILHSSGTTIEGHGGVSI